MIYTQKVTSDEILGGNDEIRHVFNYDQVAIGSSLEAAVFSYLHKIPLVVTGKSFFGWETINMNLALFDLKQESFFWNIFKKTIKTKEVTILENKLWVHLLFRLSFLGLNSFSDFVNEISFDGDLARIQMNNTFVEIKFKKCYIFNHHKISNLNFSETIGKIGDYKVYDWFKVRRGARKRIDLVIDEGRLVRKVHFPHHSAHIREAVSESRMNEKEILQPKYDENMIRLLTQEFLSNKTGSKFELEFSKREVFEAWKSCGESTELIKFNSQSIQEIIKEFKPVVEIEHLIVDLDDIYSTALSLTKAIKHEQNDGNVVKINASGSLRTVGISCYISSAITGADMYIAIPAYNDGMITGVKEVVDIPRFPLKRFGKTEHRILDLLLKKGPVKSLDSLIRELNGGEVKKSSYLKERAKISYHINKLKREELIETVREGKNLRISLSRFGEVYAASQSL